MCVQMSMSISPGIALIRKYYKSILNSLPDDHFVTLSTLSEVIEVEDFFFDQVLNCTNSKRANQRMLNSIIMLIKGDDQLASSFCRCIRILAGNKPFTAEMLEFQLGMMDTVRIKITSNALCNYP